MNETEALQRMISPGMRRANKEQMRGGVMQIMITRACDLSCYNCTQGSNLGGKPVMMTPQQFEQACFSLRGYWGVIGVFGGNPAMHPQFEEICGILCKYFPKEQRGLWCNHPRGKGAIMRRTFNPVTSNINVHTSQEAWNEFRRDWPEARPFGLDSDARHSPVFVGMQDLNIPEAKRWDLIGNCDINQHWSALIGVFRGELRAWFCEIAGAQSMLHAHEPDYPDTGLDPTILYAGTKRWWELSMFAFTDQVRKHCHDCGIPLRGYGELAQAKDGLEQVSAAHASIYKTKEKNRRVELVTVESQLGKRLHSMVDYMGNVKRPEEHVACERS